MSIRLDASGDITQRTTNLPTASAWTACCWFYYISATGYKLVLAQHDNGPNWNQIGFSAGNVFQLDRTGDVFTMFASSPAVGTWNFVALRQGGGTTTGFWRSLTGAMVTASNAYVPAYTPSNQVFGASASTQGINGRIAALKLWDAALTDAEIAAEAMTILPSRLDSLNEFWPCFPGATERLAGYSKGRNLTAGGTLTDEDPPPVSWGGAPLLVVTAVAAPASYDLEAYGFYHDNGVGLGEAP